jgi:hypothetical protein
MDFYAVLDEVVALLRQRCCASATLKARCTRDRIEGASKCIE